MNLLEDQSVKRRKFLEYIIDSKNPRKIILAGPGTGKTFTFGQLFRILTPGPKLALTFIRKLVADMEQDFGDIAEVSTFHKYCKRLLHERFGSIELAPYLTKIVIEDSESIERVFPSFQDAFQTLKQNSPEMNYYLRRGEYYRAVSFDDSVYKVYKAVIEGSLELQQYIQIVIDEYQDFNPLEVAFINQLQERSPILIVGDDDQAIYAQRNASPDYLRDKYNSGEYETFSLPYCSRCPRVIVEATSGFIEQATKKGMLNNRVPKPFVPFIEGREQVNNDYPKIITGITSNIACLSKLILNGINHIPENEIKESYEESYPCVLVIGQKQFLNPLYKSMKKYYPDIKYSQKKEIDYSLVDGYELLLNQQDSNLGWRIIAGCMLRKGELNNILKATNDGTPLIELLPRGFINHHLAIIEIIRNKQIDENEKELFSKTLGDQMQVVLDHFIPTEITEEEQIDLSIPSILFSSFEGCKGLSACHVFVVGLNNGVFPKNNPDGTIDECEYRKFIVAMTRTRKLLYLLSNWIDLGQKGNKNRPSEILQLIPNKYYMDFEFIRAKDIERISDAIFTN